MARKFMGRIISGRPVETKDFLDAGIDKSEVSKKITIQSPTRFNRRPKFKTRKR